MKETYFIQSQQATIGGYLIPHVHDNESKECAILNSMSYSLERHLATYYYRGVPVKWLNTKWNKDTGELAITFDYINGDSND